MPRASLSKTPFLAGAALLAALCGCSDRNAGDSSGASWGTVVIAATGDPDALFPPLSSNVPARQVTELVFDYLADIGPELNIVGDEGFKPALASSWSWSPDSLSISFHINPKARWHDGVPVRAEDVAYTYQLNTSAALNNPLTDELHNLDSVTVKDSLTSVFWFHSRAPDEFYTAVHMMLIVPKHIYAPMRSDSLRESATRATPIGSGRFRFHSWTQGASLELLADTANYRGRPSIGRVIWSMAPDYLGAVTKLAGGEADVFDALHTETVAQIAGNPSLRVMTLPGMDYAFLQLNLRDPANLQKPHPIFASRELRRALTMALDREAMVKNVFDTLGSVSVGPTIRALPTTNPSLAQIPFDTARAAAILDSLGWVRRKSDGMRSRAGRDLAFTMIVPSSSSARNRMAVLIQSQLRSAGVRADIEKLEFQAFAAKQSARKFDATLGAWHVTPNPAGAQEGWTTKASRKPDGRNYGAYENPAFDQALDSASSVRDRKEALRLYTRAYQTIIDDAPAIWLYEPKTVLGIHKRLNVRGAVTGAWWAGLADWTIPVAERVNRDRIGVAK